MSATPGQSPSSSPLLNPFSSISGSFSPPSLVPLSPPCHPFPGAYPIPGRRGDRRASAGVPGPPSSDSRSDPRRPWHRPSRARPGVNDSGDAVRRRRRPRAGPGDPNRPPSARGGGRGGAGSAVVRRRRGKRLCEKRKQKTAARPRGGRPRLDPGRTRVKYPLFHSVGQNLRDGYERYPRDA